MKEFTLEKEYLSALIVGKHFYNKVLIVPIKILASTKFLDMPIINLSKKGAQIMFVDIVEKNFNQEGIIW